MNCRASIWVLLPMTYFTLSAWSCSINATRPGRALMICSLLGVLSPPPSPQGRIAVEHFDKFLPGQVRIGRRPAGDKRVVDDHAGFMPDIAVVLAVGGRGVAKDVLQ